MSGVPVAFLLQRVEHDGEPELPLQVGELLVRPAHDLLPLRNLKRIHHIFNVNISVWALVSHKVTRIKFENTMENDVPGSAGSR